MTIQIPDKLKQENIRFILVQPKDKRPCEIAWVLNDIEWEQQEDKSWKNKKNNAIYIMPSSKEVYKGEIHSYKYNDPKLLSWLDNNGNYGVCGGNGLILVDFDDAGVQEKALKILPDTFTVMTGSKMLHLYYYTDNHPESFKGFNENLETLFDAQGSGKFVVGPNSVHPNGNKYEVLHDHNIAFIEYEKLKSILSSHDKRPTKEIKDNKKFIKIGPQLGDDTFLDLLKEKVPPQRVLSEICKVDIEQNPTACPMHESKGGHCLGFDDVTAHCFTKNCPVFTKDGVKNIKDIKKGDFIINRKGKYQKVTHIFKRKIKSMFYDLKLNGLNKYTISKGHPLLIFNNQKEHWKNIEDINPKNDFLIIPKNFNNISNIHLSKYIVPYISRYNKMPKLKREITLDQNAGLLIGRYLADGHVTKTHKNHKAIQYTIGYSKKHEAFKIIKLIKKVFNLDCKCYLYKKRGIALINIYSSPLADFFKKEFKTGSHKKRIGRFINGNREFLNGLIKGYLTGDGCEYKKRKIVNSTSKTLINEIQFILWRLGVIVSGGYISNQKKYGIAKHLIYTISWPLHPKNIKSFQDKNNVYLSIKRLRKYFANKIVYNLETESHSYLVPFISHNCFHCSNAWNSFTLIRDFKKCSFKEALEIMVKMAGMEKEYEENKKKYQVAMKEYQTKFKAEEKKKDEELAINRKGEYVAGKSDIPNTQTFNDMNGNPIDPIGDAAVAKLMKKWNPPKRPAIQEERKKSPDIGIPKSEKIKGKFKLEGGEKNPYG